MNTLVYTSAQWKSTSLLNKIIQAGVLCAEIENDYNVKIKIGNGKDKWINLPYIPELSGYYTKKEIDSFNVVINNKISELETDKHTHDNKEILDKITKEFTIEDKEKLDSLTPYDDKDVDKRLTNLEKDSHTHVNKSLLDQTTAVFTTELEEMIIHGSGEPFKPATPTTDGEQGLVPAPKAGDNEKFLRGDGNWVTVEGGGGEPYVLPPATRSTLGGVKVGSNINVNGEGVISVTFPPTPEPYTLPIASTSTLGGIKVGSGLNIDGTGTLSATGITTIPIATASQLGGVKIGNNIDVTAEGVISVTFPTPPTPYTLPIASDTTLGGIKVGNNLTIDASTGVLDATDTVYTLPTATASTLGGVKIGDGVNIDDGVISVAQYQDGVAVHVQEKEDPTIVEHELVYLEIPSDHPNFIVLNHSATSLTDIELECEVYASSTHKGLLGSRYDQSSGYTTYAYEIGIGRTDGALYWGRADSTSGITPYPYSGVQLIPDSSLMNKHIIIRTSGSTITVTDCDTSQVLVSGQCDRSFTRTQTALYLFALARYDLGSNGYSDPSAGKIYSLKIYENDVLTRNYVPVEHKTYGVILHEMIGNTYHGAYLNSTVNAGPYRHPVMPDHSVNVLYADGLSVNLDNELFNTGVLSVTQDSQNLNKLIVEYADDSDEITIPTYSLPAATTSTLGGIKVGTGLSVQNDGTLSADAQALTPATTSTLGGVIVGTGLSVQNDGTLSVIQSLLNTIDTLTTKVAALEANAVLSEQIRYVRTMTAAEYEAVTKRYDTMYLVDGQLDITNPPTRMVNALNGAPNSIVGNMQEPT